MRLYVTHRRAPYDRYGYFGTLNENGRKFATEYRLSVADEFNSDLKIIPRSH